MRTVNPDDKTVANFVARVRLEAKGHETPDGLREAFRLLLPEYISALQHSQMFPADPIGRAYELLISPATRRLDGQFFTPDWAAAVMANWALAEPTRLLLDPGCGSGSLLIQASLSAHRAATAFLGIDSDWLLVAIAEANRRIYRLDPCQLRIGDFLRDPMGEGPDAIICNPPYKRSQLLTAREKDELHGQLSERLRIQISRRAGLHVLFLIRALEVAAPGARLAFITPANWLDVDYGRAAKEFLLSRARVEAVIAFDDGHALFGRVRTTPSITLIRKTPADENCATAMISLGPELPRVDEVPGLLTDPDNLRAHLGRGLRWSGAGPGPVGALRLGDVAHVRRGIATGMNRFFVISEDERRRRGIPTTQLRRCLATPRLFRSLAITSRTIRSISPSAPQWILNVHDPALEHSRTPIGKYLRYGKRYLHAHSTYLASHRKPWFAPESRAKSPILFSYFNRPTGRFVRNRTEAVPLNNWLVIEPHEGIDADRLFAVLSTKQVTERLSANARRYGKGLWKLEPSELESVNLPDGTGLESLGNPGTQHR